MGSGRALGQALVDNPQVQALSFAGSAARAERVLPRPRRRRLRLRLDTGGLNTLVVLADADLAQAVDCAVQGAYGVNGHRGSASSRIVVEASLHDAFVARLRERLATLPVGPCARTRHRSARCPIATELARNLEQVAGAGRRRAEHVWGGEAITRATPGHFLHEPGALPRAADGTGIAREALFGPIACVLRAVDYEDALALANDTPDALSAAPVHPVAAPRAALPPPCRGRDDAGEPADHRGGRCHRPARSALLQHPAHRLPAGLTASPCFIRASLRQQQETDHDHEPDAPSPPAWRPPPSPGCCPPPRWRRRSSCWASPRSAPSSAGALRTPSRSSPRPRTRASSPSSPMRSRSRRTRSRRSARTSRRRST